MNKILRIVLTIVGMLSLILAVGFCLRLPWTVRLWPWADSFLPYPFLGSITAATTASLLWIGLSGELRSAAGGALHLTVFYAGLASSLFLLSQHGGDQNLLMGATVCAAGALVSLAMFLWFRRYPLRESRPMPLLVRISFRVFVVVLVLVGAECVCLEASANVISAPGLVLPGRRLLLPLWPGAPKLAEGVWSVVGIPGI